MITHREAEWVFPFESMEIGDSFFIPTLKTAQTIYVSIESGGKRAKVKVRAFVTLKGRVYGS